MTRIVVKLGTRVVTRDDGALALGRIGHLLEQITDLRGDGHEVILVSSGAVGLGAQQLGFDQPPSELVDKQACAAAGQGALMAFYDHLCRRLSMPAAQVLLTESDFHHRPRYLNLASTLNRLLALGALPILNENDTVSTAELRGEIFGDNDRLSALVASNLGADLLVLLSNVDGVFTAPPSEPGARRISLWDDAQSPVLSGTSAGGRGGMSAKVAAARMAAQAGVTTVIASGQVPGILRKVLAADDLGTRFAASGSGLSARRRWIAFATAPVGRLVVNAGAVEALTARQASLLPVGVVGCEGDFPENSVVSLVDEHGGEFARGICGPSSDGVRGQGQTGRSKALVHRDNVVILEDR